MGTRRDLPHLDRRMVRSPKTRERSGLIDRSVPLKTAEYGSRSYVWLGGAVLLRIFKPTRATTVPSRAILAGSGTPAGGGGGGLKSEMRLSPSAAPKVPGRVKILTTLPVKSVCAIWLKLQLKKRNVPSVSTPVALPHPATEKLVPAILAPVNGSY